MHVLCEKKSPFRFVTLARLTNTEDRVYWPAQSDQQEMPQLGFHLHRVVKPKLFFCLNVFLVILRHSIVDTQTWQEAGSQIFFVPISFFPPSSLFSHDRNSWSRCHFLDQKRILQSPLPLLHITSLS